MILFAVVFALLLGLCIFCGLPRADRRQQIVSVSVFILLIGTVYAGSVGLLGAPKPLRLEWRMPPDATVLASQLDEGRAIYVWLQTPDSREPRSYVLPWDTQMAQQLQNAMEGRDADGRPVQMGMGAAAAGEDGVPKFYPKPQPALPSKDQMAGADTAVKVIAAP